MVGHGHSCQRLNYHTSLVFAEKSSFTIQSCVTVSCVLVPFFLLAPGVSWTIVVLLSCCARFAPGCCFPGFRAVAALFPLCSFALWFVGHRMDVDDAWTLTARRGMQPSTLPEPSPLGLGWFWFPACVLLVLSCTLGWPSLSASLFGDAGAPAPLLWLGSVVVLLLAWLLRCRAPDVRRAPGLTLCVIFFAWVSCAAGCAALCLVVGGWFVSPVRALFSAAAAIDWQPWFGCALIACSGAAAVALFIVLCVPLVVRAVGALNARKGVLRTEAVRMATATGFPPIASTTTTRTTTNGISDTVCTPPKIPTDSVFPAIAAIKHDLNPETESLHARLNLLEQRIARQFEMLLANMANVTAAIENVQQLRTLSPTVLPIDTQDSLFVVQQAAILAALAVGHNIEELDHPLDLLSYDPEAVTAALAEGDAPDSSAMLDVRPEQQREDGEIVAPETSVNSPPPPVSTRPLSTFTEDERIGEIQRRFIDLINRALAGLPLTEEETARVQHFHQLRLDRQALAAPLRTRYLTEPEINLARKSPALLGKVWRYAQCIQDGRQPFDSVTDAWPLEPFTEEELRLPRREIRALLGYKRDIHRQRLRLERGDPIHPKCSHCQTRHSSDRACTTLHKEPLGDAKTKNLVASATRRGNISISKTIATDPVLAQENIAILRSRTEREARERQLRESPTNVAPMLDASSPEGTQPLDLSATLTAILAVMTGLSEKLTRARNGRPGWSSHRPRPRPRENYVRWENQPRKEYSRSFPNDCGSEGRSAPSEPSPVAPMPPPQQ